MRYFNRVFWSVILLSFILSTFLAAMAASAQEETLLGPIIKRGKDFVIEADDGDYVLKGKVPSKFLGKLVLVTGIVTESSRGDFIEVKSIEDIQDSEQDE